jgi:hypothetical protein
MRVEVPVDIGDRPCGQRVLIGVHEDGTNVLRVHGQGSRDGHDREVRHRGRLASSAA